MELENLPQMTIYQELEVFLTDATRSADARGGRRLSLNRYVALRHDCQKLELLLNCQVSVGKWKLPSAVGLWRDSRRTMSCQSNQTWPAPRKTEHR